MKIANRQIMIISKRRNMKSVWRKKFMENRNIFEKKLQRYKSFKYLLRSREEKRRK